VFVAKNPIDLSNTQTSNCVYVLQLLSSQGSAGGRVGGIGERKVIRLLRFEQEQGLWTKAGEWDEPELENLELPYHATGLSVLLPDRTERVVSGVIDEDFVNAYNESFR